MRRDNLKFSSLARFLSRRALRLTPAYWAALLLMLLLSTVAIRLGSGDSFPSASSIALNFLYLQNIFGVSNVFSPAWTLCIEAQFYVAFAAILWLAVWRTRTTGQEPFGQARGRLAGLLFASALATLVLVCRWSNAALFVSWWFYFAGGALGYLASRDSRLMPLIIIVLAAMMSAVLWLYWHPVRFADESRPILVGALALLFLLVGHGRAQWTQWSHRSVFQWLGNISYSLYLTHFGFGLLLARAFRKIAGDSAFLAVGFILLDMLLCLLLAHLFWLCIERPSILWAKEFTLKGDALRERARVAISSSP